jgi:predicted metalloprotease with PDZ domain
MTSARYAIIDMDPKTHEFSLRLTLSGAQGQATEMALPAWIPGSYMIRDFARNITGLRASDARGAVDVVKLDKQTWRFGPWVGELTVDYSVYAFDLSVRSAFLDDKRAFFNGTSLFIQPLTDVGDWSLSIARPTSPTTAAWKVWTTLPALDVDSDGFGVYVASDYEQLIDHPVDVGQPVAGEFFVRGVPHQFVVSEGGNFDMGRICSDMSKICVEHAAMFGELPIERYAFLTLATGDGYGGLEHRDSTSLICRRGDLPAASLGEPDKDYRNFLGLCSHEYFHLWNVKRIRPERFRQVGLQTEVHTELLWAFEGITSYYDDLALPRSGVISRNDYLTALAGTITRVVRGAGRYRQSVAESSFDAWTKFYKQDENAPNAIVSYYAKGALVAFGLDALVRLQSADSLSLDDLMRRLWLQYGKAGKGVPERGIEAEVAALLGESQASFFDDYVYGTSEMPLQDWCAAFGIGMRLRPAAGPDDLGGYVEQASTDTPNRPYLGGRFAQSDASLRLTHVLTGSPLAAAGLAPGDEIVAIDGEKVLTGNWQDILRRAEAGAVEAHYFRRGRLCSTSLPIQQAPDDTCELWWLDDAQLPPAVKARRSAWLETACNKTG